MSAEQTSGGPAVRARRRAICGAVSATKPIGPTATVVIETSATASADEREPRALDAQRRARGR